MTGQEVYNLFKQELDGEEFEDDDDALTAIKVAVLKLCAFKDWEILRKTTTLSAGTTSLAGITSKFKILDIWATKGVANDEVHLTKSNKADRFDYENETKDYYEDLTNNQIVFIHSGVWESYNLITDYKEKPDLSSFALTDEIPVFDETYHPLIAYEMVLAYKRGDESFDGYREVKAKYDELIGLLIDENESLLVE